jgi:mannose-1-phosphate guanylyltransferase
MRALILAAGKGSRLGAAAAGVPKPLVPVAGVPVLERTVRWVAKTGPERIWINVHGHAAQVREAIGDGSRFGVPIRYSHEPELLGTGGAWKLLAEEWTGTSLVIYGDNLMQFDLAIFAAAHRANAGTLGSVALFDPALHAHTSASGGQAQLDEEGRITRFVEGGAPSAVRPLVNAGAYLLEPAVAAAMDDGFVDFGHDVLPRLAAQGRLRGHILEEGAYCLGIDTPDRLAAATAMLARQRVAT